MLHQLQPAEAGSNVQSGTAVLPKEKVLKAILRFIEWLDHYGELSYDFQSFYAGPLGRSAKALYYREKLLGTLAVSPMVFCEAFVPSARRLFWKPQRFPIADAHYAMGFLFLRQVLEQEQYYSRALHFLEILERTRCPGYDHYCWGYPYNWETLRGTIKEGTPLITTVPYIYEAFKQAYQIDGDVRWFQIMRSVGEHAVRDYKDFETSPRASTCSYTPDPEQSLSVINANAYRAFLLTSAALDFSEEKYRKIAQRNLNFVIECQNPDGSWYYANDGKRHFIDHFHTCFVLKALAKIEMLTGDPECTKAIERGVGYYVRNLFDERGLPRPFSRPPRLTVYRRELYDYAECVNLAILLRGRFPEFDDILSIVLNEILTAWQMPDGSFRSRQLLLGWDDTPMHRWAQSQMFRSLCFLLHGNMVKDASVARQSSFDSERASGSLSTSTLQMRNSPVHLLGDSSGPRGKQASTDLTPHTYGRKTDQGRQVTITGADDSAGTAQVRADDADQHGSLPSYVLITPARNEEAFIEKTIESVIHQTVLPVKWVIAEDGSTDRTAEIVRRYLAQYAWIEMVQMPQRRDRSFAAKVGAFNAGYERVKGLQYEIIGNLDADISFEKDHLEFLVRKFAGDPTLGVAGTVFREEGYSSERDSFEGHNHVAGGCQLFRKQCWEQIGGYSRHRAGGIDWMAVTTARMMGWKTQSFREKSFFHYRRLGTSGRSVLSSLFSYGEKDYYLGGHPLWELFRVAYRSAKQPFLIGAVALGMGYCWAFIRRAPRPVSRELMAFHRREQMAKLKAILKSLARFAPIDNFGVVPD